MKRMIALLLLAVMLLCAGCGEDAPASTKPHESTNPTTATNPPAPTEPEAQGGAATQQELVEHLKSYFEKGCDFDEVRDVIDKDAGIAYFMVQENMLGEDAVLDDNAIAVVQTMKKGEAAFREQYPEIADALCEEMDLEDTKEELEDYYDEISDAIRNGELTQDNPNYEKYNQLLLDRDKGLEYFLEHYPDIVEKFHERYLFFTLQEAIDFMFSDKFWSSRLDKKFAEEIRGCEFQFDVTRVRQSRGAYYAQVANNGSESSLKLEMTYTFTNDRYYILNWKYIA